MAFILAAAINFSSYWFSDKMVLGICRFNTYSLLEKRIERLEKMRI
jgi:Zn-dependent protease with chaperone function